MTFAHIGGGPLDLAIELGLPLVIFLMLFLWSSRGPGRTRRRDAERGPAAADDADLERRHGERKP